MRWPWEADRIIAEQRADRDDLCAAAEREQSASRPSGPPPTPINCPECQGVERIAVSKIVAASITHDRKIIEEHIGNRYACQRCPCIYSVGPTGAFRHHRQSSPLTPEVPRHAIEPEAPSSPPELPPQALRPVPRKAPGV